MIVALLIASCGKKDEPTEQVEEKEKPEYGGTITLSLLLSGGTEPDFVLNSIRYWIRFFYNNGIAMILFGENAPYKASCTSIELEIDDSEWYLILQYYGDESCYPELYAGRQVSEDDIEVLPRKCKLFGIRFH